MRRKTAAILIGLCALAFPASAQKHDPLRKLEKDAAAAATRAADETLTAHEIEMIEYRRKLMGRPGLQLYVIFFNEIGQPIDYFVTSSKCSSSTKRLTKPWRFEQGQTGVDKDSNAVYGDFVMPRPDIDGTYGSSDDYFFCKTVDGKYKQWNGKYYVSDHPIELTIKPLVIELNGKIQSQ